MTLLANVRLTVVVKKRLQAKGYQASRRSSLLCAVRDDSGGFVLCKGKKVDFIASIPVLSLLLWCVGRNVPAMGVAAKSTARSNAASHRCAPRDGIVFGRMGGE